MEVPLQVITPRLSMIEAREAKDRSRLDAIRAGSVTALEALMADHWAPLTRWAGRELSDVDAAQDVVQEVFVQVWRRRSRWTGTGSPRAYLFRMTRSLVTDEFRRRKVRWRWLKSSRVGRQPASPPTPMADLLAEEVWRAYERAVEDLPPRRREVFRLIYGHGLTHAQVAEALEISAQTVANQMVAALKQVRRALEPYVRPDPQ